METIIEALRTPDARFADLPGYAFAPHWHEHANGLRMHYLDEGSGDAMFLCLHGQPSWSYLYRKMIPLLAPHGRVIAPDLFGFGKSDKPMAQRVYSFDFHRQSLVDLIVALDLTNVTLVCQDWGGLLGLTIPPFMAERFTRLIVMNTGMATGESPLGPGFEAWKAFNRSQPDLDLQSLFARGTPVLSEAEAAAYAAPYPDASYKAGVRQFPELVPTHRDAGGAHISRAARAWWHDEWTGKSFMAIGGSDPVINEDAMQALRRNIRNCPEPLIIREAGHFVQEWGEQVVSAALASFAEV
ncbi:Putative hydrolase or acyltransferase (Alpha/beta hydrolase superfamily) [Sphingomonas antarctica]|uniref:haloalkane dehalogenase n=1 Tax=Sphingomonas antarctica TaxID=2040274 RepID=UPI0039E8064D